jgi:tRNA-dihydrouridine synthase B
MKTLNDSFIYLAPFQGITTRVYREVFTRHFTGIDKLFTAFFTGVSSSKSLRSRQKELEKTAHHGVPVIPQILSKEADEIILFGKACHDRGFTEINWNLGCPFPRVAKKMRGSGLLPFPEAVEKILEKAVPGLPLKLSVKCRLGYHSSAEIFDLLPVFNRFPLSEMIVHARLGVQMYKGVPDHIAFGRVAQTSGLHAVYNGDIFTTEDFENLTKVFPSVHRWMLGRGLLADPFLPGLLKGLPLPEEPLSVIRRFTEDLYLAYRKNFNDSLRAVNVMKELWSYLSLSFDRPERVFGKIKKVTSFDAYEEAVKRVFETFQWVGKGGKLL